MRIKKDSILLSKKIARKYALRDIISICDKIYVVFHCEQIRNQSPRIRYYRPSLSKLDICELLLFTLFLHLCLDHSCIIIQLSISLSFLSPFLSFFPSLSLFVILLYSIFLSIFFYFYLCSSLSSLSVFLSLSFLSVVSFYLCPS